MRGNRLANTVLTVIVELERYHEALERVSNASEMLHSEVTTDQLELALQSIALHLRTAAQYLTQELERHEHA